MTEGLAIPTLFLALTSSICCASLVRHCLRDFARHPSTARRFDAREVGWDGTTKSRAVTRFAWPPEVRQPHGSSRTNYRDPAIFA